MVNEQHNQGAPASPSGRREPDPQAVPALRASVPSAIISPCGTYRYRLDRPDVFGDFTTAVIMVNPSTADATNDDATIRKLVGFRDRYSWGNLIVGNLFAYRATDVRELAKANDPIGPDNDYRLCEIFLDAQQVIFAWGPSAKLPKRLRERWQEVDDLARKMHCKPMCIGEPAKDGQPCHPLMLPYSRKLEPWCAYCDDGRVYADTHTDFSYPCLHCRAQAIEARRAETQGGSVHESAVPQGCAPKSPAVDRA